MKRIPLTQGKFALVDDVDFEKLSKYKWHAAKHRNTYYARRKCKSMNYPVRMHREIMGLIYKDGKQTDHRDGNGLNNQKYNLRICSNAENARNAVKQANNTSGYKGVTWNKPSKKWMAQIESGGKDYNLGRFIDKTEAAKAYDAKAKELFGEFAWLNFPEPEAICQNTQAK